MAPYSSMRRVSLGGHSRTLLHSAWHNKELCDRQGFVDKNLGGLLLKSGQRTSRVEGLCSLWRISKIRAG
jgi:hypothetical protein